MERDERALRSPLAISYNHILEAKSMTKSHDIDYARVLSNLKTRLRIIEKERSELLKAIESMGALAAIDSGGIPNPKDSPAVVDVGNISKLSVYDATVMLLDLKGAPMRTDDIIQILRDNGVVPKDRPQGNIATVMYKAARKRNDSQLTVNKGEWSLKSWN